MSDHLNYLHLSRTAIALAWARYRFERNRREKLVEAAFARLVDASTCGREAVCVLQVGHEGPCRPTFWEERLINLPLP